LDANWSQDVPLLTIRVRDQRDARGTVRVILDGADLARNTILVPLKVYDPVAPFVTATSMSNGDPAMIVSTRVSL
jgi:hypothetical protein